MKKYLKQIFKHEQGTALALVLVLLSVGLLTITPLLGFISTGLKSVQIKNDALRRVYAADAGVQHGMWLVQSGNIPKNVDFSQTYPAITVNGDSVVVRVDYAWLLSGIVDDVYGPHNTWLDVNTSGNADVNGVYTITLAYNDVTGNPGNKKVDKMGVWLPFGYDYVPDSCGTFAESIKKTEPTVTTIHGGTSIVWDNVNYSFKSSGEIAKQKFRFTPFGVDKVPKGDISWTCSLSSDIGLSWDTNIWYYFVTSTATQPSTGQSTTIEAHISIDSGATAGMAIATYNIN